MIEEIVLSYLKEKLDVPCGLEEPKEGTEAFVVIERTGGGSKEHVSSAVFAVQSYGKTLYEAAELNEKVKQAMLGIAELDRICKIKLNSDYNFTDTETKRYRYQAVFDLVYY